MGWNELRVSILVNGGAERKMDLIVWERGSNGGFGWLGRLCMIVRVDHRWRCLSRSLVLWQMKALEQSNFF